MKRYLIALSIISAFIMTSCNLAISEEETTTEEVNSPQNEGYPNNLYGFKVTEYDKDRNEISVPIEEGNIFIYKYREHDSGYSKVTGPRVYFDSEYEEHVTFKDHFVSSIYYLDVDSIYSAALSFVNEDEQGNRDLENKHVFIMPREGESGTISKSYTTTKQVNGELKSDRLSFNFEVKFSDLDYLKTLTLVEYNDKNEKIKETSYDQTALTTDDLYLDIKLSKDTVDIKVIEHYIDGSDESDYTEKSLINITDQEYYDHKIRTIDESNNKTFYNLRFKLETELED